MSAGVIIVILRLIVLSSGSFRRHFIRYHFIRYARRSIGPRREEQHDSFPWERFCAVGYACDGLKVDSCSHEEIDVMTVKE